MKQKDTGFVLTEFVLALAVFAIVVTWLFSLYSTSEDDLEAAQVARLVTKMHTRASDYYAMKDDFNTPALDTARAINSGIAPEERVFGGNIVSPIGTNVTFAGAGPNYTMTTQVPAELCGAVTTAVSDAFLRIRIGDSAGAGMDTVKDVPGGNDYDPVAAVNACADDQLLTLEFTGTR